MLMEPLPAVNKVFSYVQQQERQRNVLSGNTRSETIALFSKRTPSFFKPENKSTKNFNKEKPYCSHCKIPGHVIENYFKASNAETPLYSHCDLTGHTTDRCYKLHGYPTNHKFYGKSKPAGGFVNQAIGHSLNDSKEDSEGSVSLTKGQYQEIMAFLKSKDQSITPHSANHI